MKNETETNLMETEQKPGPLFRNYHKGEWGCAQKWDETSGDR